MSKKSQYRGPDIGYKSDAKMEYRNNVWDHISKNQLWRIQRSDNLKVLLMPSKDGEEIDVALNYGFKEDQIICVDENPAIIASSKWRKKHPKVHFFGCKISEVGNKIKSKGWKLSAANLDFCNNLSQELIDETLSIIKSNVFDTEFTLFITMMKGRESTALVTLVKNTNNNRLFKYPRVSALYASLTRLHSDNNFWDYMRLNTEKQYIHHKTPMIYFGITRDENSIHGCAVDRSIEIDDLAPLVLFSKRRAERYGQGTVNEEVLNSKVYSVVMTFFYYQNQLIKEFLEKQIYIRYYNNDGIKYMTNLIRNYINIPDSIKLIENEDPYDYPYKIICDEELIIKNLNNEVSRITKSIL